jgi:hypothetical protein
MSGSTSLEFREKSAPDDRNVAVGIVATHAPLIPSRG